MKYFVKYDIDNYSITATWLYAAPCVKIQILNKKITDIQKELIYRICFEYFVRDVRPRRNNIKDRIKDGIKLIIEENYNELYSLSIDYNCPIIISYLLANNLATKFIFIKPVDLLISLNNGEDIVRYYLSLIDNNIVVNNRHIFSISTFSAWIKYPDYFIDEHFNAFVYSCFIGNQFCNIFRYIGIQKPSFDILVKHIGEFDVNHATEALSLNKEQTDELKLLNEICH